MPFSDYIPDSFVGRSNPLAALADYYTANRQRPAMPQQTMPMDPNMGYPLTPQQEAMYAQASPRRVVQLTPEEMAAFNAQQGAVDTSYSVSGGDFGPEQPIQAAPVAVQPEPPQQQEASPMYPEREHELRRQDIRAKIAKANQVAGLMSQQNFQAREAIKDSLERNINAFADAEQRKPFSETDAAKSVWAELPSLRKERDFVKTIREDILQAEKIQKDDPENKVRLVNSLQTILPKMIQSAASGGSDAVQMQEFMKLAPELVNGYSEYAASIGKDSLSSGTYFQWLNSNQFKKTADPEAFIQKVKEKYNVIASARNSVVEEFQNRTSPEWFSKTGVKMLPMFKSDIESEMAGAKPSMMRPPAGAVRRIK